MTKITIWTKLRRLNHVNDSCFSLTVSIFGNKFDWITIAFCFLKGKIFFTKNFENRMEFSPRLVTLTSIKFRIFLSGQIFLTHQFVSQFSQTGTRYSKTDFCFVSPLLTMSGNTKVRFRISGPGAEKTDSQINELKKSDLSWFLKVYEISRRSDKIRFDFRKKFIRLFLNPFT